MHHRIEKKKTLHILVVFISPIQLHAKAPDLLTVSR